MHSLSAKLAIFIHSDCASIFVEKTIPCLHIIILIVGTSVWSCPHIHIPFLVRPFCPSIRKLNQCHVANTRMENKKYLIFYSRERRTKVRPGSILFHEVCQSPRFALIPNHTTQLVFVQTSPTHICTVISVERSRFCQCTCHPSLTPGQLVSYLLVQPYR
jgi:hypothetical protein